MFLRVSDGRGQITLDLAYDADKNSKVIYGSGRKLVGTA